MAVDTALLDFLMSYVTEPRKALFEQILDARTTYLTVAMENIFKAQNASAVLRTCECMGLQNVHFITERYGEVQTSSKVVVGSKKWLDIFEYSSSQSCIQGLKDQGYYVVATSPKASMTLDELPLSQPTAFLFGEEKLGLKEESIAAADALINIPMYGFTESFNISVSAALCMQNFLNRLRSSDINWHLTEEQRQELRLKWAIKSVRHPDTLIKYFKKHLSTS